MKPRREGVRDRLADDAGRPCHRSHAVRHRSATEPCLEHDRRSLGVNWRATSAGRAVRLGGPLAATWRAGPVRPPALAHAPSLAPRLVPFATPARRLDGCQALVEGDHGHRQHLAESGRFGSGRLCRPAHPAARARSASRRRRCRHRAPRRSPPAQPGPSCRRLSARRPDRERPSCLRRLSPPHRSVARRGRSRLLACPQQTPTGTRRATDHKGGLPAVLPETPASVARLRPGRRDGLSGGSCRRSRHRRASGPSAP